MNDWALYLGGAALLCAVCSLLGAGLEQVFGVDTSRETPGAHRRGAVRRLLLGRISGFLAALPAALWMSATAGEMLGRRPGAAVCAVYALLCAMLGFCTMFTCARCAGKGMAHVYGEEFLPAAEKIRYAIGVLAAVFSAGVMLMSLIRDGQVDVTNGHLLVFSLALWPMLSMEMASSFLAPFIRSERQMLSASAGAPVCAALIAILSLLPGKQLAPSNLTPLALLAGVRLCWIFAFLTLCCLGGRALHGLTKKPFERKKRSVLPHMVLCMAAGAALALYAQAWLFMAAAALCMVLVTMDALTCAAWLRRIGRGLFLRY